MKIGMLGAAGRMGRMVDELCRKEFESQLTIGARVDKGDDLTTLLDMDVVIDFSTPEAVEEVAHLALKRRNPLPAFVIGSTGWSRYEVLSQLAHSTPVFIASNFSPAVYLMNEILQTYSPLFKKLGYTPVLTEVHHSHKKDAPSGTALSLLRSIDNQNPEKIQTHSVRAGEVIGEHEVCFYGNSDRIELKHVAQDRSLFARGAILAAIWVEPLRRSPNPTLGSLGMKDFFNDLRKGS